MLKMLIFTIFFLAGFKETKNELTHYDEGSEVLSLCVLKNGNLAVSYSNNRLNLIDPWTGQTKSSIKLKEDVNYLATSKSDKLFGMTSTNKIYMWKIDNLFLEKTLEFQTSKMKAFSLLPNDNIVLAFYSKLKLLDPFKEKEIKNFGNYAFRNSIVSLNDNEIASTNFNLIEIYNLSNFKKVKFFRAHDFLISSLVVLNNGDLVSASYDKSIKVWDAKEGVLKKTLNEHKGQVCILAALNDGNLASGSADNTIKIWNTATGMLIKTLYGHSNWVRALAVINENYLVSGSVDKSIKIWNLKTNLLERTIYNICISSDCSNQHPLKMSLSKVKQNFHLESEAGINRQINIELTARYVYQSMAFYFDRDDVALHGFHKFFKKSSEEEREHAEKLMKYQNKRGGRIVLREMAKPEKDEWGSALEAVETALELEKKVNQSLLDLHQIASNNNDAHLSDFIESEFLDEQVESIKQLSEMITKLKRAGPGLGEFLFDKDLH